MDTSRRRRRVTGLERRDGHTLLRCRDGESVVVDAVGSVENAARWRRWMTVHEVIIRCDDGHVAAYITGFGHRTPVARAATLSTAIGLAGTGTVMFLGLIDGPPSSGPSQL